MKTASAKTANKNSIRKNSINLIGINNFDIDKHLGLDDDDETDTTAGKTTGSKHGGTTKTKSIKVSKPSKGKLLPPSLVQDATRSTKRAKRPSAVKEQLPSTTSTVQQLNTQASPTPSTDKSSVVRIDKLQLAVSLTPSELEGAVERARQLVRDKTLTHRSSKSEWFKHLFVLTFGNGAKIVFLMEPNKPNVITQMQLIINPNHVTAADVPKLISVWKELFGFHARARDIAASMAIMRLDACADSNQHIDDLIIDMDGAMVGAKFYVKTDRGGKIQTNYMGSVESAHHGIAYDQDASDDYKQGVGEVTSRQSMRKNAELVLEQVKGRMRIESRRVFKQHLSLAELAAMTNPFGAYKVYDISKRKGQKFSLEFLTYLDCVRLRGIQGAKNFLSDACSNSKVGLDTIRKHEQQLARLAVTWWKPQDFNDSLLAVLKAEPIWHFLRPMQKP